MILQRFCAMALGVVTVSLGASPTTAAAAPASAPQQPNDGVVIDRIVAVVNREVITLGELDRTMALQLSDAGAMPAPTCGEPQEALAEDGEQTESQLRSRLLECLIDELLVFQHVRRFPQPEVTQSVVDEAFQEFVESFPSRQAFDAELSRWGLTAEGVRLDLKRQLMVVAYIDSRFRAFVDISEAELRQYYEETLLPELLWRGVEPPAFETVDDESILPILREAQVNIRVSDWIRELRERAEIVVYLW